MAEKKDKNPAAVVKGSPFFASSAIAGRFFSANFQTKKQLSVSLLVFGTSRQLPAAEAHLILILSFSITKVIHNRNEKMD